MSWRRPGERASGVHENPISARGFRNGLLAIILLTLILDLSALGWVIHKALSDRDSLVQVRNALFTHVIHDRSYFELSPENQPDGFTSDSEASKLAWLEQFQPHVAYIDDVLALKGDEIERAKAIVPLFSRNGSLGGCGDFRDLADTLMKIGQDAGYGCCSDHSQSFLALASLSGIAAREIFHTDHVFAEFYHPATEQWVWIDPQFALMARNKDGRYLSFLELRDLYLEDQRAEFEFIGNKYHVLMDEDPHEHKFFDEASDFAAYSQVRGNNVFEQDAFNRRFEFLPVPARQFLGLITKQLPGFYTLSDGHSTRPEQARRQRTTFLVGTAGLGIMNLVAMIGLIQIWIHRRPLPKAHIQSPKFLPS